MIEVARNHRFKTLLLAAGAVALVAAGVVLVLLLGRSTDRPAVNTLGGENNPWKKPGTDEIDWDRINALSGYDFALNAESGKANLPVKGRLQVSLSPEELAKVPDRLDVYRLVPLVSSDEEFERIAEGFGLSGPISSDAIHVGDGIRGLYYHPEQDELMYVDEDAGKWPKKPPKVPSEKECDKIALDFCSKAGILPPGSRVMAHAESNGGGDSWGGVECTTGRTVIIGLDLYLGGYGVRGAGMQCRVNVVGDGKISYINDNLRRVEPYGSYRVKPIEQALAEAQAGTDTVNLEPDSVDPTVSSLDIFYYCDTSERSHGLLMPVYAFMSGDCCIYVPAVIPD
jgi:hypothetical protein